MENVIVFSQKEATISQVNQQLNQFVHNLNIVIFKEPVDALFYIMNNKTVNGIIVDVDSRVCDDLKFIKVLRGIHTEVPMIFLSMSGRYALEAFEYGAFDYLKLPLNKERTVTALTKMKEQENLVSNGHIYIRTFGSFEITIGGKLVPWKNSKTKELLALLVDSRGANISNEKIQSTLWPDVENQKAASNYHTTSHNLRKKLSALGIDHIISIARGSQRVNTETFTCDLYEFEKNVEEGSIDSYKKAFDLYRGQYMENNFYEWSRFTKVRTDIQFEQVCHNI